MLVKMTEVYLVPNVNTYNIREVFVNPEHVTAIREDHSAVRALNESRMPQGLNDNVRFSMLFLNTGGHGLNMTVVGSPTMIQEKLVGSKKILKG